MYEVFTNMSMYIYILGPVTDSLPAIPQWAGTSLEWVRCWECRTGSMSVDGIMWYIDGLLPCTQANLFREFSMYNT